MRLFYISNLSHCFILPLTAILGRVITRETEGDFTRYDVQVKDVFKRSRAFRVRRGIEQLWIKNLDLSCRCPRIKLGRLVLCAVLL